MTHPPGDDVLLYDDVAAYYDALLAAINRATQSIRFCFFAMMDGQVTTRMTQALVAKAREGVEVRVLLDGVGMVADQFPGGIAAAGVVRTLTRGGVTVRLQWPRRNHRWRPPGPFGRIHAKLVVVDGRQVFTGGSNIGDWYATTRDTNFAVTGALAGEYAAYFDFLFTAGAAPDNADLPVPGTRWGHLLKVRSARQRFFAGHPAPPAHPAEARLLVTCPGKRLDIRHTLLNTLMQADQVIQVRTWYFVPDPWLLWVLAQKARSGVRVQVLHSAKTKVFLADAAARWAGQWLQHRGVQVHGYTAAPLHAKTFRCDDTLISGSPNLDTLSFYANHETAFVVQSTALSQELDSIFQRDLSQATPPAPWDNRSQWVRDLAAYLFFPLL